MRRFRVPEIVLAALFGLIFGIGVAEVTSLQAEHCYSGGSESPAHEQPVNAPDKRGGGDQKPSDYYQRHPISCGIGGLAPSFVAYMDEHEGFFVGLFTGLLFIATIGLWRSTNALWDAGERQIKIMRDTGARQYRAMMASNSVARETANAAELNATAVIESQRARLFVVVTEENFFATINLGMRFSATQQEATVDTLRVTYRVKNYGKTPAILKEISHQIIGGRTFPRPAEYAAVVPLPIDLVIGSEGESRTVTCHMDRNVTVADVNAVRSGRLNWWFYGYVSYEDTFSRGHELRFVWSYNHRGGGFRLHSFREIHAPDPEDDS
jgi:hypothetical protein